MIIEAILLLLALLLIGAVAESLLHYFKQDNESSRKLVHVIHGVGLAALAFILPLSGVILFEVIFLMGMFVARYLHTHYDRKFPLVHYLGKMYRVGRSSYGDLFFPVSTMIVALVARSKWEFAAAILVLGLADAVAALIGKRYGKKTSYEIFGQKKSLAGSAAFFVVAFIIIGAYMLVGPYTGGRIEWLPAIGVALLLTATENVGVYGSDNLLIPLAAVAVLNLV